MANSSVYGFSSIRLLSKVLIISLILEIGTTIYFEIINSEWSFVLTVRQLPSYLATLFMENVFNIQMGFGQGLGVIVTLDNFNIQMGFDLALGVIVTLVFLFWFYKAYENLPSLGAEGLRLTTIGIIAAWFIPILNSWMQYTAMMEIWKVSHPHTNNDDRYSWRKIPRPKLVVWWFITFTIPAAVLGAVAYWIFYVINAQYLPLAEDIALVIHAISSVVSNILLIFILRYISTWQQEKHQCIKNKPVNGKDNKSAL